MEPSLEQRGKVLLTMGLFHQRCGLHMGFHLVNGIHYQIHNSKRTVLFFFAGQINVAIYRNGIWVITLF